MNKSGAFICGCSGMELTADEKAFYRESDPWGLILFKRNITDKDQIRALVDEFRSIVSGGEKALVLIDQEGGRVQRMGPPNWRKYPAADGFYRLFKRDPLAGLRAAQLGGQLLGADLYEVGINTDCLPVLDVPQPGAHEIVGDRAYGASPMEIALLARAHVMGLMAAGCHGVIKHIPGHGRAMADSHLELPLVDASYEDLRQQDFVPFAALADLPMAMTAHVVYSAIDDTAPATLSAKVIHEVIRGEIGFEGLLMSDDLSMKALSGIMRQRGVDALAAGCDILLHCNGDLAEMQAVAEAAGRLQGRALARANNVIARLPVPKSFDENQSIAAIEAVFEALA